MLVATTLAAYVMDQADTWSAWLRDAELVRAAAPGGVDFFAAIEVDARGAEPFTPLLDRLGVLVDSVNGVGEAWWTFSLDDGRTEVTTANRLRHITTGQNLAMDRACAGDYSHLLFLAADCAPPVDIVTKLVEVDEHVVGAYCPTYCLPIRAVIDRRLRSYPLGTAVAPDVLAFSAAAVMFDREAFRLLRWRWDRDTGMTDDPCMQADVYARGWQVYVRPDCRTVHHPTAIPAVERRGHDMRVVRPARGTQW